MTKLEKEVLIYCMQFTLLADHSGNMNKTFVTTINNLLTKYEKTK